MFWNRCYVVYEWVWSWDMFIMVYYGEWCKGYLSEWGIFVVELFFVSGWFNFMCVVFGIY